MHDMVPIIFFVCVAAVLVLRPITRPFGRLLDAMAREHREGRQRGQPAAGLDERHLEQITDLMDRLNSRLELVEERVHFMERLLERRPGPGARLADQEDGAERRARLRASGG